MIRLAVVCTHPIQYYSPVFVALARRRDLEVRVFYGWPGLTEQTLDPGFGQTISWDIPLLEGYEYEFVDNVAKDPGSHHFAGIDSVSLVSRIKSWKADVLLVYGWCYKSHLRVLRQFHGRIPVLFRGDSTLLDERPGLRQVARRWFLWWLYKHVDIALYVGTNNRSYYKASGLRPEQLVFAPHAIDNKRFDANSVSDDRRNHDSRFQIRRSLGIEDDQVCILFIGKLEPKKAPDVLIRAFQHIESGKAHLVLVGSGELQSELERSCRQDIHFVGFKNQRDLPAWYRAADLLVLPSRGPGETWGLALNEAMAAGLAVIASDRVGAAVDLIAPGHNGWICRADDLESLADCLNAAIAKGLDGLREMGIASNKIIQDWSIEIQAEQIAATAIRAAVKPA